MREKVVIGLHPRLSPPLSDNRIVFSPSCQVLLRDTKKYSNIALEGVSGV